MFLLETHKRNTCTHQVAVVIEVYKNTAAYYNFLFENQTDSSSLLLSHITSLQNSCVWKVERLDSQLWLQDFTLQRMT